MRNDYLKRLGIDRWVIRQNTISVLPACYAYELQYESKNVGLLFAIAPVEDEAVCTLLKKIIAALKCESHGQWYPMQPSYVTEGLRFVITLGDGFEVMDSIKHIHSYAPQKLIVEPQLKAETWQTLQAVFSILD